MQRSSVREDQLRRVCMMYRTNKDAAEALGISKDWLYKLCKKYGVVRPVTGKYPENFKKNVP